jgi:hypothetical protein
MAVEADVKKYIACWMQLGKKVWIKSGQSFCLTQQVLAQERYSPEFEDCWSKIMDSDSGDCYLDGTAISIREMLGSEWEILDCPRCDMPVSMAIAKQPALNCPCHDLPNWPNTELPLPHSPIDTQERLYILQKRLAD